MAALLLAAGVLFLWLSARFSSRALIIGQAVGAPHEVGCPLSAVVHSAPE